MAKKPVKKRFFGIEIPLIREEYEVMAYLLEDLEKRTIKKMNISQCSNIINLDGVT